MYFQDLLDNLATGEFSNLALVSSVTGSIKEESYPKIVNATNRGLLELYKRLCLKKKKVIVVQQEGLTRYYLRTKYLGYQEVTGEYSYLLDHSNELFLDDIIRVISIEDADGKEIRINPFYTDTLDSYFKVSQFDALDLYTELTGQVYTVTYQAKYPKIVIEEDFDPDTFEVNYPPYIEEALTNYIASSLTKGKVTRSAEGEAYASNTFAVKYEREVQRLLDLGLVNEEEENQDTRFSDRGFV